MELHFVKYTSFGNTFIIIDETLTPLADDVQRAAFARWALNGDFGIGGTDNVLYLSKAEVGADFVFRIFEHDGSETLSCGNGLLSTATALSRSHAGSAWGVLTEMPTGRPRRVEVGLAEAGRTFANVGRPRATSTDLFNRPGPAPASGIDEVGGLTVPLPPDAGLPETVTLNGHLVFTGEPHLVLISGRGLPSVLEDRLYVTLEPGAGAVGTPPTTEMRASNRLIDHIGRYVNENYRRLFPQGVHLNFARLLGPEGPIEYRTYERAIDIETLACGSGAVAMAYVAQELGLLPRAATTLWPHRCRWHLPDASLGVEETDSGFVLTGRPRLVCAGTVPLDPGSSAHATSAAPTVKVGS